MYLFPRLTVYYDGAITKEELYDNIDDALVKFIENMKFDSLVYSQKGHRCHPASRTRYRRLHR